MGVLKRVNGGIGQGGSMGASASMGVLKRVNRRWSGSMGVLKRVKGGIGQGQWGGAVGQTGGCKLYLAGL